MRGIKQIARGAAVGPALALGRLGVTPNGLTIAGALLTASTGLLAAQGWFFWAGIALWIFSLTDTLDGALARATGRVTRFGAFLDSLCDRYAEAAVFLGLVWWYHQRGDGLGVVLAYLAIIGSLMVSYARARAEGVGLVAADVGWFQRPERIIALGAGLIAAPVFPQALTGVLLVLAAMTTVTVVQRARHVARALAGDEPAAQR